MLKININTYLKTEVNYSLKSIEDFPETYHDFSFYSPFVDGGTFGFGATVVGTPHFGHLLQCFGNGILFLSVSSQHVIQSVQSFGIRSRLLSSSEQHLLSGFCSGLYLSSHTDGSQHWSTQSPAPDPSTSHTSISEITNGTKNCINKMQGMTKFMIRAMISIFVLG